MKLKKLLSISIAIVMLTSTFLVRLTFIRPVKCGTPYVDEYTQSGLVGYNLYQTGGDQVVAGSGNDGTYVAAKGDLTIKETDLYIPGRGLSLSMERVYTTPAMFKGSEPYGYENPPIDIGKGWTLNFPWIGALLHLWDGTCYEIKWSGNIFENHQGTHFKLVKEADNTYTLYKPSGTTLYFDASGKLEAIEDNNGNRIAFAYANDLMINITDTVGRVVYLSYSNNKLVRIAYDGMTVDYTYANGTLVKVKDVQGRHRCYDYHPVYNYWLISKVVSPEGGYKTYTYARFSAEGEDGTYYKYKLKSENRYSSNSTLVGSKVFTYAGNFSCITRSETTIKDGNGVAKVRHRFMLDSEGLTKSLTVLDIPNTRTYEYSETHSNTQQGVDGTGYWIGDTYQAHYCYNNGSTVAEGHTPVGPFTDYPGTMNCVNYTTAITICGSGGEEIAATTYRYQENRTTTHAGITGIGYWEGAYFNAYFSIIKSVMLEIGVVISEIDDGYIQVGPFEHYPSTSGYKSYTTTLSGNSLTVTTFWNVRIIPKLKEIVYTYNERKEVIREDVYLGDNDTVAYSIFRRYDDWGNLVYSKNSVGHERFYSYANTETAGIFVDYYGNPKTGFSNLFYSNGVPSNIHSTLLGKAELQDNGTAIETYNKYDSSGNKIESRKVFGGTTSFIEFSGTFDESGSTSFPIDLTGVNAQGNAMLKITGLPKQEAIPKTETHKNYHKGVDGTGYWKGKYFKAHYFCVWLGPDGQDYDEGYIDVGPFDHYPGTPGYKRYTTSVDSYRHWVTVKTYYNKYVNRYPAGVDYHFNGDGWKTITDNLETNTRVQSIPTSELVTGMNTLYFRESSSYTTKLSWKLYVPIYTPPIEDLKIQYAYDTYGNVISVTDAEGSVTIYEYGSEYQHAYLTNTISTINGHNITTSSTYYFARGLVASVSDPYGYTTSFEYDNLGRTTKVINLDGSQGVVIYDDGNNIVTSYDELGHFSKLYYDGLGRTLKTERYLNESEVYSVQVFTYNYEDKIVSKTIPHQPETPNPPVYTTEYDVLGRVAKQTNPDGTFLQIQHDDLDNKVTVIDANQHKKESKYDWVGRLLWVKEYYNDSSYYLMLYEYNEIGNLIKVVDAKNQTTIHEHDSIFGRTKTIYPDSTSEQIAYNKVGNVIWAVNRNGDNTTFAYDELHRLVQTAFADNNARSFAYDDCSRLILTSHVDYSCNYYYDSRGRIIQESHLIKGSGGNTYDIFFAYDVAGRLVNTTYPDGLVVSFEYDGLNRVTRVYSGNYTFASYSYNVDSTLRCIAYGNDLLTTYTYDNRLRPTNIVTVNPSQGNLTMLSLSYSYDNVGNILQIVNGRRTPSGNWTEEAENYEYDWLDRLVSAQGGFGDIQYSYDAVGNRIAKTENGVTTTYQYDACNRLLSYQNSLANATFTYDNNGNLKTKTVNDETWHYVYNAETQLYQVVKGEMLGSYRYDANGRRVYQLEGSKTTTTVYSGLNPTHEHITQSAIHTIYDHIYGPTGRVARISGDHVVYYHSDHLGSTRLLTNASGATVVTISYKPFGEAYETLGNEERFGFNSKEIDSETGLYYYVARYYDPQVARFTQADSYPGRLSDPQSQNRYAYCKNNPLRYVDPTGHTSNCGGNYGQEMNNWVEKMLHDEAEEQAAAQELVESQSGEVDSEKIKEQLRRAKDYGTLAGYCIELLQLLGKGYSFFGGEYFYIGTSTGQFGPLSFEIEAISLENMNLLKNIGTAIQIVTSIASMSLRVAEDPNYSLDSPEGVAMVALNSLWDIGVKLGLVVVPGGPAALILNSILGDPIGDFLYKMNCYNVEHPEVFGGYYWNPVIYGYDMYPGYQKP